MSCITPLTIKNRNGNIVTVPCGHCIMCSIKKTAYINYLVDSELMELAKKQISSTFLTLTYDEAYVPLAEKNGELVVSSDGTISHTLRKSDFQKFVKRCRHHLQYYQEKFPVDNFRFLGCGEYGGLGRPHYHILLLGVPDYLYNKYLADKWTLGHYKALPLKQGASRYICKYFTKQVYGEKKKELYDDNGLEAPFVVHSQNLGWRNIKKELEENDGLYTIKGNKLLAPTYLRKKLNRFSNIPIDVYKRIPDKKTSVKKTLNQARNTVNNLRSRGEPVDDSQLIMAERLYSSNLEKYEEIPF